MENEHDRQQDRRPGCVEEGEDAGPGQELAHGVEIAGRLGRAADLTIEHRAELGGHHAFAEFQVQLAADPHQNARSNDVEPGHDQQQSGGKPGQDEQRRFVPAGQHTVVDLHHVKRGYEHQKINERAEYRRYDEGTPTGRKRNPDF
jgi:hypothetical protein